jgi:hypothetical protein
MLLLWRRNSPTCIWLMFETTSDLGKPISYSPACRLAGCGHLWQDGAGCLSLPAYLDYWAKWPPLNGPHSWSLISPYSTYIYLLCGNKIRLGSLKQSPECFSLHAVNLPTAHQARWSVSSFRAPHCAGSVYMTRKWNLYIKEISALLCSLKHCLH